MTKSLWTRGPAGLRPADAEAEKLWEKLGIGETVSCEVRRPRNVRHHRLYWALLNMVADNMGGEWKNFDTDALHNFVKLKTGHATPVRYPGAGDFVFWKPKSISFAAMDQEAFNSFFNRALDALVEYVVPHIPKEELRAAVESELVMA